MEDLNAIAADCVVICCCCCCCQCLILQVLIFALLRLPAKLAKRATDFAKRKLKRKRRRQKSAEIVRIEEEEYCVRVGGEREREIDFGNEEDDRCEKCMGEVEKVMMELYEKGEFGFGSFWGRGREREESACSVVGDGDGHFAAKYQIIQMAGSFTKT